MSGTGRILMVEDSVFQRKIIKRQLEAYAYEVFEAASGFEGEQKMKDIFPDAVLLDWDLPDCKGPDLLKKWTHDEHLRWIPVLMVTSHSDPKDILYALECGAVDYLKKPAEPVELVARLRTALRIKRLQDQLRDLAVRDPLTALYNRRYFFERLAAELSRAQRTNGVCSCALVDLDYFKKINDVYGHDMGDRILCQLAALFHKCLRQSDVVARYGGEEFVLLFPGTSHELALQCLERIHQAMATEAWGTPEQPLKVNCSIGLATYPSPRVNSQETLLKAADEALYLAKEAGRGKIVSASQTFELEPHLEEVGP